MSEYFIDQKGRVVQRIKIVNPLSYLSMCKHCVYQRSPLQNSCRWDEEGGVGVRVCKTDEYFVEVESD